jgi:putative redox protein
MTVALYARRKGWALEEVTIRLEHARIHAADCAECETKAGLLDRVDWAVRLGGDLTREQRTRLLEIAQMCPVHRTLRSEIHIPAPSLLHDESSDASHSAAG